MIFVINPVSPNFYLALKSNKKSHFIKNYEEDLCGIIKKLKTHNHILQCLNLFNSKKTLDAKNFDFYDSLHPKKKYYLNILKIIKKLVV